MDATLSKAETDQDRDHEILEIHEILAAQGPRTTSEVHSEAAEGAEKVVTPGNTEIEIQETESLGTGTHEIETDVHSIETEVLLLLVEARCEVAVAGLVVMTDDQEMTETIEGEGLVVLPSIISSMGRSMVIAT